MKSQIVRNEVRAERGSSALNHQPRRPRIPERGVSTMLAPGVSYAYGNG